ncbi:reverse transcriptase domain-containing protein, partial [Tanacetum coccineum]
ACALVLNSNRQQQQVPPTFVEPFNLVEPIEYQASPVVTMADNRTMAQLHEAPTEGYEDAIVVPEITANNFELKHGLLTLVQNKHFFRLDKEDPHAHIRYFNKITSTMKFSNVPSTSVKLMLFPFSLEGAARIWLEKEPPRSILTWDDLVSKFINKFFPPSKTTNLRNEITRFQSAYTLLAYFLTLLVTLNFDEINKAIFQMTPRGRSHVSCAVYYEVTPPDTSFRCDMNLEGVTDWYQRTGYRELEHFLRHSELHNGLIYTSEIVSCTMVSLRSQTLTCNMRIDMIIVMLTRPVTVLFTWDYA